MPNSGLPKAKKIKKMKMGNIVIRPSIPKESTSNTKQSIDTLEKAAQKKVFVENAEFA